ncbi:hypothetical protein [Streptomyces lavenduligriseus]|uniref:Uncharacterized protein n=1 Tax=Streptomyces lavenduligriseus TaxID=67315 RepID=A0ABT0P697_9ACTN|nr:hypothetical protein [Streptomyces lavenduligriseus]MCL3998941.1 hypothetical protein [Streptomyces lavenduligriseus]
MRIESVQEDQRQAWALTRRGHGEAKKLLEPKGIRVSALREEKHDPVTGRPLGTGVLRVGPAAPEECGRAHRGPGPLPAERDRVRRPREALWRRSYPPTGREGLVPFAFVFADTTTAKVANTEAGRRYWAPRRYETYYQEAITAKDYSQAVPVVSSFMHEMAAVNSRCCEAFGLA